MHKIPYCGVSARMCVSLLTLKQFTDSPGSLEVATPWYFKACSQNFENRLLALSCLTDCPSVRMEQLGSHWTDFHEIWYLSIFRKYVKAIQFLLKLGTNNVCFTRRPTCIPDHISLNSCKNDKCFWKKVVEKIKTHFVCSVTFFLSLKSCSLWGNVEEYCRAGQVTDDNITRRMRIAFWIPKARHTHTHTVCICYCSSTEQCLHERSSMLLLAYIACLV